MSQNGRLTPNLDEKSTKVLNLTVLQRIDPFVEEILITAAHVTFYEFNIDTSQWSRKDVEGSLFVVKRNTQPRFQFIVMNRRNTDNLVENLLGDFEYEVQVPYLLYRNASQEVNGIWFYNARECEEVANLFNRILNAYSKVPTKSKVSSSKSEFEELEAVPTLSVMDGPLEPSASTTSNFNDVPDDPSFVNFFSEAIIAKVSNKIVQSAGLVLPGLIELLTDACLLKQPKDAFFRTKVSRHLRTWESTWKTLILDLTAMNVGPASNAAISGQTYHSSAPVITTSHPQVVVLPTIATAQAPSVLSTSTPILSILDSSEANATMKRTTDLVKPSSFFGPPPSSSQLIIMPPVSSAIPTAPPLNPPGNLQRPYGVPLLQPFPPPTPPSSLTPAPLPTPNYGPTISREKVQEALQMLVQDNQFIDMVYRAVLNAHQT